MRINIIGLTLIQGNSWENRHISSCTSPIPWPITLSGIGVGLESILFYFKVPIESGNNLKVVSIFAEDMGEEDINREKTIFIHRVSYNSP